MRPILLLLSVAGRSAAFRAVPHAPGNAKRASVVPSTPLCATLTPPAPAAALLFSGGLAVNAARAASRGCWQSAAVGASLACLAQLDLRPTMRRQLADSQSALDAITATDMATMKQWRTRAGPKQVWKWANLVRGKVAGEVIGLAVALRAPCSGACIVLLSHCLFWRLGAASACVDAAARPAPLPPPLARMIATADAVVLTFAALAMLGPTAASRSCGAALFSAATASVSAEAASKAVGRRRKASAGSSAASSVALEDLPDISIKGGRSGRPEMLEGASPSNEAKQAAAAPADPQPSTSASTTTTTTSTPDTPAKPHL